ncbi:MAG: DUF4191 domain-containing protein [Nocardioidaceae bacterium]
MARKDSSTDEDSRGNIRKIIDAYRLTKKQDPKVGIVCLSFGIAVALVVGVVFGFLIHPIAGIVLGIPAGVLAWLILFGRRAEKAAYAQVEGQPGAAAAALGMLRRGWKVQTAVSVTKSQDLVHRVVGRPGVILVGEGNPGRVHNLLSAEKKKHARVVGEMPIYDIVAGDGEGEVPIRRLSKHIMKLPRNITPADITDVMQRLKALDAMRPSIPMPKGPMPTSLKQARQSMRQSTRNR